MPLNTINFDIPFADASQGAGGLVISPTELKEQFLWGIPLCNPANGETISELTLRSKIQYAQEYVETMINAKLFLQYYEEQKDFVREEYQNWGYLKTSRQITKPYGLTGRLNEQQVTEYPIGWLTIRRPYKDSSSYWKNLYVVPNGTGMGMAIDFVATSNFQWLSLYGSRIIPNYWLMKYQTGFENIPKPIMELVGKVAAIEILPILEQTITGGGANAYGLSSQSLSMDGLSQSASKANGGNIFQQRIRQYTDEIKQLAINVKSAYVGIAFEVV